MKKIHKDHIAGFLYILGNLLLYGGCCSLQLLSKNYYSLLYYHLYRISILLYPLLTICLYFLLHRKRTAQFRLSVALCGFASLVAAACMAIILSTLIKGIFRYAFACYLPLAIDLILRFISKRRANKRKNDDLQADMSSVPVSHPNTEEIVFEGTESPIGRGISYSVIYMLLNWIAFICLAATPLLDSIFSLIFFAFTWFASVPFYFMLKQECSIAYLVSALISMVGMTILCFVTISHLMEMDVHLLPRLGGFLSGIIYIIPLIVLPIYGLLPIFIDGLVYIGRLVSRVLVDRERRV